MKVTPLLKATEASIVSPPVQKISKMQVGPSFQVSEVSIASPLIQHVVLLQVVPLAKSLHLQYLCIRKLLLNFLSFRNLRNRMKSLWIVHQKLLNCLYWFQFQLSHTQLRAVPPNPIISCTISLALVQSVSAVHP